MSLQLNVDKNYEYIKKIFKVLHCLHYVYLARPYLINISDTQDHFNFFYLYGIFSLRKCVCIS
jgi:hypothetical protein